MFGFVICVMKFLTESANILQNGNDLCLWVLGYAQYRDIECMIQ